MEDAIESQKSFFKHMTDLDSGDKAGLMNMLQYTLIAIIPIVLVLNVNNLIIDLIFINIDKY